MHPSGADSRGVVLLGDSAGAHFHIPPEWMTVTQMSAVRNHVQLAKSTDCHLLSLLCCRLPRANKCKMLHCIGICSYGLTCISPSHICSYEDKKAKPCATAAPPASVQLGQGRVWLQCPSAVPETQTRTSGFPCTCLQLKETHAVRDQTCH